MLKLLSKIIYKTNNNNLLLLTRLRITKTKKGASFNRNRANQQSHN